MPDITPLLKDLGYPASRHVADRLSIATLYRSPRRRCGVYVLHFANGEHYVGKAVNVVRRYGEHRKAHADIERLSFLHVAKSKLDETEKRVVYVLEQAGCHLRNINLVSFSYAQTQFEQVMPQAQQQRWITDLDYDDLAGERPQDDALRRRYHHKYAAFMALPRSDEALEILAFYVKLCVPAAKRSEIAFWNVSCRSEKYLYARINIGKQRVFDLQQDGRNGLIGQFYLTEAAIERITTRKIRYSWWNGRWRRRDARINIAVRHSDRRQGGQNQCSVTATGLKDIYDFLSDASALREIRQFNLGLAQKGSCFWGRYHCLDLADHFFG